MRESHMLYIYIECMSDGNADGEPFQMRYSIMILDEHFRAFVSSYIILLDDPTPYIYIYGIYMIG